MLLIHGFAEDHRVWDRLVSGMQNQYKLLVPDLPGSGSTSLPKEGMTMELMADFLKELLEEEKIEKVTLLGHSMGGYVMMAFLEKYPESVNGIGFIHSTSMSDDDAKKDTRAKAIRLIQDYPSGKSNFLSTLVPNLFSVRFKETHPEKVEEHLTRAMEFSSEALVAYYRAMMQRKNRMDWIRDLSIPVLFVIGGEDQAIPKYQNLQECHLPLTSFIEIMESVGHMSMYENGEGLNKTVQTFLQFISHH